MFKDLHEKDVKLYKQNGLLDMLDRNRKIKLAPEQWYTEANEAFDVIITCEERCFDAICEDLTDRGEHKNRPVHIINIDIKDNHEDAMLGGRAILQLAQMVCLFIFVCLHQFFCFSYDIKIKLLLGKKISNIYVYIYIYFLSYP